MRMQIVMPLLLLHERIYCACKWVSFHAITLFYCNNLITFRLAAWPVPLGSGTRGDWHEEIYAGMLRASGVGMNGT